MASIKPESPVTTELARTAELGPRIPEVFLDVPSQRLYALSLGLLCQAIKIFDIFQYYITSSLSGAALSGAKYTRKWVLADFIYIASLSYLRIPRLNYANAVVLLQVLSLWFLDGIFFGTIRLDLGLLGNPGNSGRSYNRPDIPSTPEPFRLIDVISAPLAMIPFISFGEDTRDAHLQGQHTVRMSPISTAQLNPNSQSYCLASSQMSIMIPILLNNTAVGQVQYSVTPLGNKGEPAFVTYTAKDLEAFEKARVEALQIARPIHLNSKNEASIYDYDDEDEEEEAALRAALPSSLQSTQTIVHIPVTSPGGTVRLERVIDASKNAAARLAYPLELVVAPCPSAEFDAVTRADTKIRCSGQDKELGLGIELVGVPPLSLKWYKEVNGKREHFVVEGIEGVNRAQETHADVDGVTKKIFRSVEKISAPLVASLTTRGTYIYVLEEVTDGVGNSVFIAPAANHPHGINGPSTIYAAVLRRPSVSFRHCAPGMPASILIGGETSLEITAADADALDAPWEIALKFKPSADAESVSSKKRKAYAKKISTTDAKKEVSFTANAPGQYMITSVRGKWCEGDVMVPDTCVVIEKPKPAAEIEWKRIHECSGDTGVSASLLLHGTPPFQVYYRTQRNSESPRDQMKTFSNTRGELNLQPERSGRYVYTFTHLSDANYNKIELNGPSIDQVVHPLAAAEFVGTTGQGRGRRNVNSCSGDTVDIDVDLRGSGPWNIELQVVGPKGSEIVHVPAINTPRKTVKIPIPSSINLSGGSFDIDLISVEDANGCKRPLIVPGVSVKVRRMKPTAKFYGKTGFRSTTVLEDEHARLPLRLTGDGPWDIKYRWLQEPTRTRSSTVRSANDALEVSQQGIYEILEVHDSQCPGSVDPEASTYSVDWIQRPQAVLDPETVATYIIHNRSHILPPICEGLQDHVDLDLTGRAPFQLLYNIAQDDHHGGTDVIGTPMFSSIQPRTRFELHTYTPGRKYYEVKQVGDAAYPIASHKAAVIPASKRLLFEQDVRSRPAASFIASTRLSYCLNDAFSPRNAVSHDGLIQLQGVPPFELTISIKDFATSKVHNELITLTSRQWTVAAPSYIFTSIGPHLVTIESIRDATKCEHAALDPTLRFIWVDVAETAAIIPYDRRSYYCIGDISRFQLEGTPPWSIGYTINSKKYITEARASPFSLVQQQPGEFSIISVVAEKQKMCKAALSGGLSFEVKELPSAKVGHGKRIYQDIHEGDQAEIVFSLIGEPPFTFTYQRSEPPVRKGGNTGKVLETHTVTNINSHEYPIFSALEGTWTVTSISDRYCRYPSAQLDN